MPKAQKKKDQEALNYVMDSVNLFIDEFSKEKSDKHTKNYTIQERIEFNKKALSALLDIPILHRSLIICKAIYELENNIWHLENDIQF